MRRWRRRRRLQFGNLQRHANILQQKSFKVVFSPQTKRSVHLTFVDHNDNDGNVYDVEDEFEAEVANSHDKFTFSKQNVIVIFDAAVSSPLLLSTYTETCIEKVHLSLSLSLYAWTCEGLSFLFRIFQRCCCCCCFWCCCCCCCWSCRIFNNFVPKTQNVELLPANQLSPKKTAESLVLIDFSGRNCFQMETVPHKINKLKKSLLPTRGFRNGLIL